LKVRRPQPVIGTQPLEGFAAGTQVQQLFWIQVRGDVPPYPVVNVEECTVHLEFLNHVVVHRFQGEM
jgi:hypothetical protein